MYIIKPIIDKSGQVKKKNYFQLVKLTFRKLSYELKVRYQIMYIKL